MPLTPTSFHLPVLVSEVIRELDSMAAESGLPSRRGGHQRASALQRPPEDQADPAHAARQRPQVHARGHGARRLHLRALARPLPPSTWSTPAWASRSRISPAFFADFGLPEQSRDRERGRGPRPRSRAGSRASWAASLSLSSEPGKDRRSPWRSATPRRSRRARRPRDPRRCGYAGSPSAARSPAPPRPREPPHQVHPHVERAGDAAARHHLPLVDDPRLRGDGLEVGEPPQGAAVRGRALAAQPPRGAEEERAGADRGHEPVLREAPQPGDHRGVALQRARPVSRRGRRARRRRRAAGAPPRR